MTEGLHRKGVLHIASKYLEDNCNGERREWIWTLRIIKKGLVLINNKYSYFLFT